jgi:hypothetical protein
MEVGVVVSSLEFLLFILLITVEFRSIIKSSPGFKRISLLPNVINFNQGPGDREPSDCNKPAQGQPAFAGEVEKTHFCIRCIKKLTYREK